MAKQMDYTDPSGVLHENSVWIPLVVNINHLDRCGRVEFFGFKDRESALKAVIHHSDKKQPLYGAKKSYDFFGEKYDSIVFGKPKLSDSMFLDMVSDYCYTELAEKTKDVQNDKGEFVSFFENAVDISLTKGE